jgi:DNA-binding beta-propeller fold protein YncE
MRVGMITGLILATVPLSLLPFGKAGAAAPYLATDLLGQTDGSGAISWTTNDTNNSSAPNDKGVYLPLGVTIDTVAHRMFVSDASQRILVYNLSSGNLITDRTADYVLGQSDFISSSSGTTATKLNSPRALAMDSARHLLFVADTGNNRVLVYDTTTITNGEAAVNVLGQPNLTSSTAARTQTGFDQPRNLAYDDAGDRLFVGEFNNARVMVIDTATITDGEAAANVLGQPNFTASGGWTQASTLNVWGLAFDPTGQRLFVANAAYTVVVFDVASITDGENATNILGAAAFGSAGTYWAAPTASNFSFIDGIGFDSVGNRLFVSDRGHGRVSVFDTASITNNEGAIAALGATDTVSYGLTNDTTASTVRGGETYFETGTGILYIADQFYHRVTAYDATGAITNNQAAVNGLGQVAPDGSMIFTNGIPNNGNPRPSALNAPFGSVTDPVAHKLYLSDGDNNRVLVYNLTASNHLADRDADAVLGQPNLYSNTAAVSQSGMHQPHHLALDPVRKLLFVSDYQNIRVLAFDVTTITNGENAQFVLGQPNFTSNSWGAGASQIGSPTGLAYDQAGQRLFVADDSNARVSVFNLASPTTGMAATNVLGQADWDAYDTDNSQTSMYTPTGLAYDPAGQRLFVADPYACRVTAYDVATITDGEAATNVLGEPSFTAWDCDGGSADSLSTPAGVAYDSENQHLFVTDQGSRVLMFDVAAITDAEPAVAVLGQPDFVEYGDLENSQTEFGWYGDNVSIDNGSGNVYIADYHEHRVMNYRLVRLVAANFPNGTTGSAYTNLVTSAFSQGTVSYALVSGALPPGLTLASNGDINGTTTTAGTYNFRVRVTDNNGAIGSFSDVQDYSITVANPPSPLAPAPSSGPSEPEAQPDEPSVEVTEPTPEPEVVLNEQTGYTSAGTTQTLAEGEKVTFTLTSTNSNGSDDTPASPEKHSVTVDDVGTDYADITIASDPIKLRLYIGETKQVDVDGNGSKDLEVKLADIVAGQAKLVFRQLAAPAPSATPSLAKVTSQGANAASDDTNSNPYMWVWIVVGGVVVAGIIGLAITLARRRSRNSLPLQ